MTPSARESQAYAILLQRLAELHDEVDASKLVLGLALDELADEAEIRAHCARLASQIRRLARVHAAAGERCTALADAFAAEFCR